mgnify:CR=1 FL=1
MVRAGRGYVLYYTAHHRTGGISCIGRAFSASALGPFVDPSPIPLVCQSGHRNGSIDPSPHVDRYGRPWLLWTANDGLRSEAAEEPRAGRLRHPGALGQLGRGMGDQQMRELAHQLGQAPLVRRQPLEGGGDALLQRS